MSFFIILNTDKSFETNLSFLLLRVFMCFGCFYTTFIIYKEIELINSQRIIEENLRVGENRLKAEQEQYNIISKHIEETRIQRHDFKHHVAVITALAENGELEQLRKYISKFNQSITINNPFTYCQNYALNSLICYYKKIADEKEIDCEINLTLVKASDISDTELCIIFGNLFENAIEACTYVEKKKRFISIKSIIIGNMISVAIDNSFDGCVEQNSDYFLSRKREYKENGIGLSSVKTLIERYGGIFDISYDEFKFIVNFLIPHQPNESENEVISLLSDV